MKKHLAKHLPSHVVIEPSSKGADPCGTVSAAPWGQAGFRFEKCLGCPVHDHTKDLDFHSKTACHAVNGRKQGSKRDQVESDGFKLQPRFLVMSHTSDCVYT